MFSCVPFTCISFEFWLVLCAAHVSFVMTGWRNLLWFLFYDTQLSGLIILVLISHKIIKDLHIPCRNIIFALMHCQLVPSYGNENLDGWISFTYRPQNDPDPKMIPNPKMIPKWTLKWYQPRNDPPFFPHWPRNDSQVIIGVEYRSGIAYGTWNWRKFLLSLEQCWHFFFIFSECFLFLRVKQIFDHQ